MKYLCLIYYDERNLEALAPAELDALVGEALAYDDLLRRSGHYVVSNALQSVECATTIRMRQGKVSTTDGPFAETKEQVGAFVVVEAADRAEAVRLASLHSAANLGEQLVWGIEVRDIEQLVDP